jgi:hypothetical protein
MPFGALGRNEAIAILKVPISPLIDASTFVV